MFTQDVKIVCEIDIEVFFFNLLNENTIFYLIKTKKVAINLFKSFSWKYLLLYLCWLYTCGLKCQRLHILVSCEDSRNSRSAYMYIFVHVQCRYTMGGTKTNSLWILVPPMLIYTYTIISHTVTKTYNLALHVHSRRCIL